MMNQKLYKHLAIFLLISFISNPLFADGGLCLALFTKSSNTSEKWWDDSRQSQNVYQNALKNTDSIDGKVLYSFLIRGESFRFFNIVEEYVFKNGFNKSVAKELENGQKHLKSLDENITFSEIFDIKFRAQYVDFLRSLRTNDKVFNHPKTDMMALYKILENQLKILIGQVRNKLFFDLSPSDQRMADHEVKIGPNSTYTIKLLSSKHQTYRLGDLVDSYIHVLHALIFSYNKVLTRTDSQGNLTTRNLDVIEGLSNKIRNLQFQLAHADLFMGYKDEATNLRLKLSKDNTFSLDFRILDLHFELFELGQKLRTYLKPFNDSIQLLAGISRSPPLESMDGLQANKLNDFMVELTTLSDKVSRYKEEIRIEFEYLGTDMNGASKNNMLQLSRILNQIQFYISWINKFTGEKQH